MNKAEEQYLYEWGRTNTKSNLMLFAFDNSSKDNWLELVKNYIENSEIKIQKMPQDVYTKGLSDYNSEILRFIDGKAITDWPSFVTYMTGETYE